MVKGDHMKKGAVMNNSYRIGFLDNRWVLLPDGRVQSKAYFEQKTKPSILEERETKQVHINLTNDVGIKQSLVLAGYWKHDTINVGNVSIAWDFTMEDDKTGKKILPGTTQDNLEVEWEEF